LESAAHCAAERYVNRCDVIVHTDHRDVQVPQNSQLLATTETLVPSLHLWWQAKGVVLSLYRMHRHARFCMRCDI
jgi:hypothetical protein